MPSPDPYIIERLSQLKEAGSWTPEALLIREGRETVDAVGKKLATWP